MEVLVLRVWYLYESTGTVLLAWHVYNMMGTLAERIIKVSSRQIILYADRFESLNVLCLGRRFLGALGFSEDFESYTLVGFWTFGGKCFEP